MSVPFGLDWRFDGIPCVDRMDAFPSRSFGDTFPFSFAFRPRPGEPDGGHKQRHADALSRLRYAGEHLDTYQPISGRPMYRDQSPDRSLLVEISLAEDVAPSRAEHAPTMWGVIVGGDDATPATGTPLRLDVEVFYLADLDELAGREAVQSRLEAQGP